MTRTTNARIAGIAFLAYIAAGIGSMALSAHARGGDTVSARLLSTGRHAFEIRLDILSGFVQVACAIVLAVTLYSITRDEDRDLALMGFAFRCGEGLLGAASLGAGLDTLWLARTANNASAATVDALGTYMLEAPHTNAGAALFAFGSACFSYLLLRGRMIPTWLAWLGVAASVLLVVALPLGFAGFLAARIVAYLWLPMAAYEIPLGFWLIFKGARPAPSPAD